MDQQREGLVVKSLPEALGFGEKHNWLVCFRPAFILSTQGGFPRLSHNREQFEEILKEALDLSPISEVLLEPN